MNNKIILLLSDHMGDGSKELGAQILETYFNLLKNKPELPVAVFCMNQGVYTMTDESFVSVHLKELSDKGVEILACKTCVDYFNMEDKLTVGKISGMDRFIELSNLYDVITIS